MLNKKLFALIFIFTLALAPTVSAKKEGGTSNWQRTDAFEPTDCSTFDLSSNYECGYVTVPEEHANPNGPSIRLAVAVLRATGQNPEPDPLFIATGGPGGSGIKDYNEWASDSAILEKRDIVLFDQRGTFYSEPNLLCTEVFDVQGELLTLPDEAAKQREQEAYQACYQRLQAEGINLSAFDSLENAADMQAIRAALGYDEINFFGASYGTLLGLHLMKNYPDHLRSVILDGVAPTDLNYLLVNSQNTERIFREFFGACEANAVCRADYPDLEQRFSALVDQLNQQPTPLSIINYDTGETFDFEMDGNDLTSLVAAIAYLPGAHILFPRLVAAAERGNYGLFVILMPLFIFDRSFSEGMYLSVICAEDADFVVEDAPLDGVRPIIAENGKEELQSMLDRCASWHVEPLPPAVDEPVVSDIPTLLLSGRFDPVTPPWFADEAAKHLSNSYNYVHPTGSHGVALGNKCIDEIVIQFIDNPAQEPDTACLSDLSPTATTLARIDPLAFTLLVSGLLGLLSVALVLPGRLVARLRGKQTQQIESNLAAKQLWQRGVGLVLLYSVLLIVFVVSVVVSIIRNQALLMMLITSFQLVFQARTPLLLWIFASLVLLAVGAVVVTVIAWRKAYWSGAKRAYYTFLTLCALGIVIILAANGMVAALF